MVIRFEVYWVDLNPTVGAEMLQDALHQMFCV